MVLAVQYLAEVSGSWVVLRTLLEHLDQSEFRLILAVPDAAALRHQVPPGIEVRELPIPRLRVPRGVKDVWRIGRDAVSCLRALRRLIRTEKVDIVHCNALPNIVPVLAAASTRTPSLWHVHEAEIRPAPIFRLLIAAARHLPSRVVAVSDAVAKLFAGSPRCKRIYNGIDTRDRFAPLTSAEISAARKALALPDDAFVVAMLARLAPIKGADEFIRLGDEVLGTVDGAAANVRFLLAGDPAYGHDAYAERILQQLKTGSRNANFHHASGICEPRIVLAAADVVVQCSTIPESFGLTLVEALALERPVIASPDGASPEIVRHEIDGFLVATGAVQARAGFVARLYANPALRSRMGRAGRERVELEFSAVRFAQTFADVYRELAGVPREPNHLEIATRSLPGV